MEKIKTGTRDLKDENFEKIAQLFPSCVTETVSPSGEIVPAIDFDKLRQELDGSVVENEKRESYDFTWPGKSKSSRIAGTPTNMALRPCREKSRDYDSTKNLYIEGDNLQVMKLLRETYLGKVKMIYIDPPYNTGNDFVYDDNYAISEDEYNGISGDFDELGNRLRLNTASEGRVHTNWLNMIYPRLKLANDFLSDDGVIFISIDDSEIDNLKKVCLEAFGKKSYVATFPWRKRTAKSDVPFGISQDYEWIVCYAKPNFKASVENENGRTYYQTLDFPGRPWRYHDLTKQTTASERPNSFFTIVNPKDGKEYPADPDRTWCVTQETYKAYLENDRIIFPGDYEFLKIKRPVMRYFKEDDMIKDGDDFGRISASTCLPEDVGMSKDGTARIGELFGFKVFSFPKPVSLVEHLINITFGTSRSGIVMDFFAGSSTTAEAVMTFNAKNNSEISFISVQLPEACNDKSEAKKQGYQTICDIGRERIIRAGSELKSDERYKNAKIDVGFRTFKLDSSNMKNVEFDAVSTTKDILSYTSDNIKPDRGPEDLLIQSLLAHGIPLSSKIEVETVEGKSVFNVDDGYLMACFDTNVDERVIECISNKKPRYAVFRDASMKDDSARVNLEKIFETNSSDTVLKVI